MAPVAAGDGDHAAGGGDAHGRQGQRVHRRSSPGPGPVDLDALGVGIAVAAAATGAVEQPAAAAHIRHDVGRTQPLRQERARGETDPTRAGRLPEFEAGPGAKKGDGVPGSGGGGENRRPREVRDPKAAGAGRQEQEGMAGGVGGFYLAASLGYIKGLTGDYQIGLLIFAGLCFVALAGLALVKARWRTTWGAAATSGVRI